MTTRDPGASDVLTHGLADEPAVHRPLSQEAGCYQHLRVGGVGAAGDGGDHHVAVDQAVVAT